METTIKETLLQLVQALQRLSETALLDAQVLVAHHLGKSRSWVVAHPEVVLQDRQFQEIRQSLHRLEQGEPLPYVIGHWEFYGLDFLLTQDVLIPRPETELLVERAIAWLQLHPGKRCAVDVGTGSGCIGISILKHIPDVHMLMTDVSASALTVARRNVEQYRLLDRTDFRQTDLISGIDQPFDLICANLPYIPTHKLKQLPVAKREPRLALDGGGDGLSLIRRLLDDAAGQLIAGGLMCLEIDEFEGDQAKRLAQATFPRSNVKLLQDISGKDRCLEVERPNQIVHLCLRQEWLDCQSQGEFRDVSLMRDGFIHCSQPEQIIEVANRYFQGVLDLVILWMNPEKLVSELRWERAGNVFYPHVYGPINLEAIDTVSDLKSGTDGIYRQIFPG